MQAQERSADQKQGYMNRSGNSASRLIFKCVANTSFLQEMRKDGRGRFSNHEKDILLQLSDMEKKQIYQSEEIEKNPEKRENSEKPENSENSEKSENSENSENSEKPENSENSEN